LTPKKTKEKRTLVIWPDCNSSVNAGPILRENQLTRRRSGIYFRATGRSRVVWPSGGESGLKVTVRSRSENLISEVRMKTFGIAICVVVLLCATFVISSHNSSFAQTVGSTPNPALTLNTVSLNFTTAQMVDSQTVRAFVPTGSKSVNCLTTLNEMGTNFFPTGITVFCGEREPSAFGGVPGMLVSVFLPQPAPPDFVVSVTLYQQGAKKYGAPVLCTGADGC
jgi:hypothetical protein